jgi:hypothetical protein
MPIRLYFSRGYDWPLKKQVNAASLQFSGNPGRNGGNGMCNILRDVE